MVVITRLWQNSRKGGFDYRRFDGRQVFGDDTRCIVDNKVIGKMWQHFHMEKIG